MRELVRGVFLDWKTFCVLRQPKDINGTDSCFIGRDPGLGGNRDQHRKQERREGNDRQNLRAHLNAPRQKPPSTRSLRLLRIVRMS